MRVCLTPLSICQVGEGIANFSRANIFFFFSKLQLLESCERLGQLGPEEEASSQDLVTLTAELNTGAENLISSNVSACYRSVSLLIGCQMVLI